ncbi:MAG TPA: helix-turn-helix transcriptional regulator [Stellaceae bacterium]|nr:helix-turn-helix transcriptional regulator [Stellaceae bacterium]
MSKCLAATRSRARVTQRDLAARLGKPQSFVSAYENGQRRIDVSEFLVILETLRARFETLLRHEI